jgi:hypothetical protein
VQRLNADQDFVSNNYCYSFAAMLWYHFSVQPILQSRKAIEKARTKWTTATQVIPFLSIAESPTTFEKLGNAAHLSLVLLQTQDAQGLVDHVAMVLEDGVTGEKFVWEKDGEDPIISTPLECWAREQGEHYTKVGIEPYRMAYMTFFSEYL